MARVYLDSAPIIYLVEDTVPYSDAIRWRLAAATDDRITSELSRLECRVKPMRDGDALLLQDFDRFFNTALHQLLTISLPVIDTATTIRAKYGFATPDCIHLATAIVAGCDVFYTNDRRLMRITEIAVETVAV